MVELSKAQILLVLSQDNSQNLHNSIYKILTIYMADLFPHVVPNSLPSELYIQYVTPAASFASAFCWYLKTYTLSKDVATLLERLGFNGDETCLISVMTDTKKSRAKVPDYVPAEINLRVLLKTCLDLRSPPKKLFMRALAEVTEDPEERRRLEELCSKQVKAHF